MNACEYRILSEDYRDIPLGFDISSGSLFPVPPLNSGRGFLVDGSIVPAIASPGVLVLTVLGPETGSSMGNAIILKKDEEKHVDMDCGFDRCLRAGDQADT